MRRFSKSKWNADEVVARTGLDCALVAASFDAEVFRPRLPEPAASPVRIAAMVRPSTPRRQPTLTVDVLRALEEKLGDRVEIVLFGSEKSDPALRPLRFDFPHRFAGVLDDRQLSALLSQVHVFADLSTYQALGVASLEAMASGAAVVVPEAGGAGTFARHEVNALAVDTSSREACLACLKNALVVKVARCHFCGQEHPPTIDARLAERPSQKLLTVARGVRLGGIKVGVAKIQRGPQGPHVIRVTVRLGPRAATNIPRSESYLGKAEPVERFVLHFRSPMLLARRSGERRRQGL
jgi:hypothetical protein